MRRVGDTEDRRRVLIELTEVGAARAWEIWGPLGDRGRPALARYSAASFGC